MLVYFKPYFTKQHYSLSGFSYVSSSKTLQELQESPYLYEWLESNHYSIRAYPSNDKEMAQIGDLCFRSEFIYLEDLKEAIQQDPSLSFPMTRRPPIIHLT
jgi:hypothetical protein